MSMDFKKPGHAYESTDREPDTTTVEAPAPAPQPMVVKKGRSLGQKFMTSFLLILLMAATGYAVYSYLSEQKLQQKVTDAENNSKLLQEALRAANKPNATNAAEHAETDKIASFSSFLKEYGDIRSASVQVDQTATKKDIESALKSYYKLNSLPSSWDVLAVYQVVKPQTPPTGELHALVYWPATDTKPAGFIDMIKPVGAAWKYNEQL
jgi:uncharacterized protein HemX